MYLACGSEGTNGFAPKADGGGFDTPDAAVDLPDGQSQTSPDGAVLKPTEIGSLSGTVFAPEGTIPISDALVYLTKNAPADIPAGVFCDSCVKLTPDEAFAFSAADGSVRVPVYAEGEFFLVVQKGQFRRVRRINVVKGVNTPNKGLLQLPGKTDDILGDTIPKMFVNTGTFDKVEHSLDKLGISYDKGSSCNDLFGLPGSPKCGDNDVSAERIFNGKKDPSGVPFIDRYQIVFAPCSGSVGSGGGDSCTSSPATSSDVKNNMRRWVKAGGKFYVTDWSYEMVRQIWPGYFTFQNATAKIGSGCSFGSVTDAAVWEDPGLASWMTAIGENGAQLVGSYTGITAVSPQQGEDFQGNPKTITPKVWASGKTGSAKTTRTVTFPDRCGRVLFSTYHTEGSGESTLLAQEKALLYVLLEVGVCVGPRADGIEK